MSLKESRIFDCVDVSAIFTKRNRCGFLVASLDYETFPKKVSSLGASSFLEELTPKVKREAKSKLLV